MIPSIIGIIGLISFQGALSFLLFAKSEKMLLTKIKERVGCIPIDDTAGLQKWCGLLGRYFSGEPVSFSERVSFLTGTDFQKKVWGALAEIPYGTVASYQSVANRLRLPQHARAVGMACGANPLPVIIPCHRVVQSNGSLGGYTGGIAIKKRLLAIEGWLRPL
jgi:O-6-methylguanine DNA methyltransferase